MKRIQKLLILLCIVLSSCENESFEPLVEKIDANSELYANLKDVAEIRSENSEVVCLTFIYPFNVYLYNDNGEITQSQIINENREFVSLLGQIDNESAIGLSYPISGTTNDGNTININNNLELKEAIEACIEDQIISYCNDLLEQDCVWKIESLNNNNLYNTSYLKFYDDGTGVFYHNGNSFRTSWISLYIEEQLHININLEGDSSITEDWNFDWTATIIDENTIIINNELQGFEIKKNCNIENNCDYVEFRECESDNEDEAQFVFDNYVACIASYREASEIRALELTFYETIDDAEQQINPLPTSGYNNITNPQVIFVVTKNVITEVSEITRIVLFEELCSENE
ncbi:hypothetical protein [Aquimarina sp. Aq107]|uniref:hypothetical protein n=1 Tax=Aquimarina sp. Aq107 TaxID=1191912 RepID=UPI000D554AB7|nr:hypothetical protein [Aquimarina sp. Aq107]